MRSNAPLCALLFCLGFSSSNLSMASELPFGADGLFYLSREATAIVISTDEVQRVPAEEARVPLFDVRIESQLVGEGVGDTLRLAVPGIPSEDSETLDWLQNAMIFLRPPMSPAELEFWRIQPEGDQPVLSPVSGRLGLRPAQADGMDLPSLVLAHRAMDSTDQRLGLVDELLSQRDPYLQRSAVLELLETSLQDDQRVLDRIEQILEDQQLDPTARSTGLQVFLMAPPPDARETLWKIATTPQTPDMLRRDAAAGLLEVEGGDEILLDWSHGDDPVLQPTSRFLLKSEANLARPAMPDLLEKERFTHEELGNLSNYFTSPEVSEADKIALLKALEAMGNQGGATGLLFVGSSPEAPSDLRARALEGLSRYSDDLRVQAHEALEAETVTHTVANAGGGS